MDKEELIQEYESGALDRVARLQNLRGAVEEHTGMTFPRRPHQIEDWWERHKSVFAKKLKDDEVESQDVVEDSEGDDGTEQNDNETQSDN